MRFMICLAALVLCLPHMVFGRSAFSKARAFVETGAQVGTALGVEGPSHSTFRAVTEIGVMFDRVRGGNVPKKTYGITLYNAIGDEDFRIGIKPRLRYRFRPNWSADFSAGLIFASLEGDPAVSNTGFAGSISLNYSSWLSLKADVNIMSIADRPRYQGGEQVGIIEGGQEISIYGGASLRNKAGLYATIVGAATFLAFVIGYMAETAGT